MPLEDDTVYSYRTRIDTTNDTGLLVMRITRPRASRADLDVAGRVKRVEITPEGIRYVTGGHLLKLPLEPGATWEGRTGTVRVSSVDQAIDTPAGRFESCLETVEASEGGATMSRIVSVYCPDVGLVSLDIEAEDATGYTREHAVLTSYGKRVDLTRGGP